MTCIVFETPGLLDLKAITTFGMNAKPNTKNPIGFFGTGLKYAIAVLVRNKIPVTIFIGNKQYDFYVKDIEFREKGFGMVMYKARQGLVAKWKYVELPFTTELGKNWELWQAFREIESNTRDENGRTYHDTASIEQHLGKEGYTKIVIGGEAFAQVWAERDKVFLPEGLSVWDYSDDIQILKQPSQHIYYRGLRVQDLEKPSMFTYNILKPMDLTEDRTLKYSWVANSTIAEWVARSKDQETVAKILSADDDKFFEGKLDFDSVYVAPGEVFMDIVRKKKAREGTVLPRALTYYSKYTPPPTSPEAINQKYWYKLQKWLDDKSAEINQDEQDLFDDIVRILKRVDE